MNFPSVSPIQAAASSVPTRELTPLQRAHAAHLHGSALRNASPAEQRAAVASQFEAILVRNLLGKTLNSMLGSDASGAAASVYGDLLTDTVAQQLTAGRGLGLGGLIEQQLTPRGEKSPPAGSPPSLLAPS